MTNRMPKRADLCVFIGRFQPFHNGHLAVVKRALETSNYLLIVLGSANDPRRADYIPFTWREREMMIRSSLSADENQRILCVPVEDSAYNLNDWVKSIQEAAQTAVKTFGIGTFGIGFVQGQGGAPKISLIGHSKDNSSFYLKLFPQWDSINVENHAGLSATPFRRGYFAEEQDTVELILCNAEGKLPPSVVAFLREFRSTADYREMVAEQSFIEKYKSAWANAPYKPMFVTTDALVVQGGNILLIRRKARPGKGLWANPGGFLEQDERIIDGIIRELREETGLKVPTAVLKGSMVGDVKVFDHPHRSSRGRTITHAALFHLQPQDITSLPKVKGLDDAMEAKWWPLSEVTRGMMFEDHYSMIQHMTALI